MLIGQSLGVHDQSREVVHKRPRPRRDLSGNKGSQLVGACVGHEAQLLGELVVIEQELGADIVRDPGGRVRNVNDVWRGRVARHDLEGHPLTAAAVLVRSVTWMVMWARGPSICRPCATVGRPMSQDLIPYVRSNEIGSRLSAGSPSVIGSSSSLGPATWLFHAAHACSLVPASLGPTSTIKESDQSATCSRCSPKLKKPPRSTSLNTLNAKRS